jgi:uncharacterized protein YjbI with pentapeptide repeats
MSVLTFKDLVDLKADEWNTKVAEEYGIPVEEIKEQILRRDLRLLDNRLTHRITKDEIEQMAEEQKLLDRTIVEIFKDGDSSVIYEATAIDKFKIKITDTEDIVDSVAITGKIIIGATFRNSNLSSSYFCGCTFYQCNLSNVDFGNSVFIGCDFVNCNMHNIDFNGSTISRCHIYECNMNSSVCDYVALSDSMIVACNLDDLSITQSRILFTGFNDCSCVNVKWKESDIIQCAYTSCDCKHSDFKRVTLVDSIIIRCILIGCDLNSLSVTCITVSDSDYDDRYKHFFEREHLLYSPSIFEWSGTNDDNAVDDEADDEHPW